MPDLYDAFTEDEGLPQLPITPQLYWDQVRALVLGAFVQVALALDSEGQMPHMLLTEIQSNPLSAKMTEPQRLSAWRLAQSILRLSEGPPQQNDQ